VRTFLDAAMQRRDRPTNLGVLSYYILYPNVNQKMLDKSAALK